MKVCLHHKLNGYKICSKHGNGCIITTLWTISNDQVCAVNIYVWSIVHMMCHLSVGGCRQSCERPTLKCFIFLNLQNIKNCEYTPTDHMIRVIQYSTGCSNYWHRHLAWWWLKYFYFLHYRTLNYKAQKFAMVLSSLDIHRINGSLTTLVFFCPVTSWLYSSAIVCWTWNCAWNPKVEFQWGSTLSHLRCCFQAISTHWN